MKQEEQESNQPPISRLQFALSDLGLVIALFMFLGAGNLQGVKATAITISFCKILGWYYYDRKIDLLFAVGYILAVAGWQSIAP